VFHCDRSQLSETLMKTLRERRGRIHLGGFFHPTGNHVAAWLHPDAQIDAGVNFSHYVELAQTAERAKFDLIFIADTVAARDGNLDALKRWPQYMAFFDPTMLMAGFASVTQRIGLVATASTSFNEPYNIARRFASLDHMSGGRAGWNVVTSSNPAEAYNFGLRALPPHDERYAKRAPADASSLRNPNECAPPSSGLSNFVAAHYR
jgi:alkanesulfonate monooxygenase SsuD/methylene tetrahydromethanopterin reductase-like flavin-dependent oxidoreductase (luciferase family)